MAAHVQQDRARKVFIRRGRPPFRPLFAVEAGATPLNFARNG